MKLFREHLMKEVSLRELDKFRTAIADSKYTVGIYIQNR